MFDLLQPIPFDPFHQILHSRVLLPFQRHGLPLHLLHDLLLILVDLILLLLTCLLPHELRVVVLFHSEEDLLLIPQSDKVLPRLVPHVVPDLL